MKESEIIVKMREALDILKLKWQEAEGDWACLDFMQAALHPEDSDNWVRKVVEAENLSNPYMENDGR